MTNNKKILKARSIFLLAGMLFYGSAVSAQANRGRIVGLVTNLRTGEPIPNANVMIDGTVLGAAANRDGEFVIERIAPGTYRLTCSAIGFQKESAVVRVIPGKATRIQFRLQETAIQMSDLVVTATKNYQTRENVPVRIDLLRSEDLKSRNFFTLDQALQYVPGVQMAGNNISIRGSSSFSYGLGTRTLVLLDGVPFMSGDEGKASFEAIPISEVQRVEVMKGAGSALYGSSAMGGVINIITRKPHPDSATADLAMYSGFYSHPSYPQWRWNRSRRMFRGVYFDYQTTRFGVASNFAINYQDNDNFKQNADFRHWNFYSKFRFNLGVNTFWDVLVGLLNREEGGFIFWKDLNHALLPGNEPEDSFTRTRSEDFFLQGIATHTVNSKFYYRLRFNYVSNDARDVAVARPGHQPEITGVYRGSTAHTFGNEMQFVYQPHIQHNLVWGWEGSGNSVHSIQYGDRKRLAGSLYSQYSWQMTPGFKFEIGARWDIEQVEKMASSTQINPKIGLTYHLSKSSHWRFSLGRGFRAPSIGERFISTFANQIQVLPNLQLRPERNVSLEFGLLQKLARFAHLDAGYFFTDYWDLIEPRVQSDQLAVRFENVTRARIQGIEVSQNLSFLDQHLQFQGSYTYIHTRNLSRTIDGIPNPNFGQELNYRPRDLLYLHSVYSWRGWMISVDFRYISKVNRVDRLTNIPDITRQVPAYITDLQFGYQKSRFSLLFKMNNIFQYYYLISPGNLGDIRNYILQIRWRYR